MSLRELTLDVEEWKEYLGESFVVLKRKTTFILIVETK